jgi:FkbM family methyltransferase
MTLLNNTWNGFRYLKWSKTEAVAYLLRGISRETKIALPLFEKQLRRARIYTMNKFTNSKVDYYDFNGAKFPKSLLNEEKLNSLKAVFEDVLLFFCHYNDDYSKEFVMFMDKIMVEGPYGYTDGEFDVTVKEGDIVIDAGAWIGDFSAYAACKGADVYAFEPTKETYDLLCATKELNDLPHTYIRGKIYPVRKGLGSSECEMSISIKENDSLANKMTLDEVFDNTEKISLTTLDRFAEENKLERIDFIKADIEGAERDMLRGATNVLKTFAPKLAICTYHLPDDPEVLENIIKEANPNYTVVQLRKKLFAAVVKK